MKNLALVLLTVSMTLIMSCNKPCNCTTSYSGVGSQGLQSTSEQVATQDSGNCSVMDSEVTNAEGLTTTIICE